MNQENIYSHSIWLKVLFLLIFICSAVCIINSFIILHEDVIFYRIASLVVFFTYLVLLPFVVKNKIIIRDESIEFVGYRSIEILFKNITGLYRSSLSQYYLKAGDKKYNLKAAFPDFDEATLLIWKKLKQFTPELITDEFHQNFSQLFRSVVSGKILFRWLKRYGLLFVIFIFLIELLTFNMSVWLKSANSNFLYFLIIYAVLFPIIPLLRMISNINTKLKDVYIDTPVDDLIKQICMNTGFARVFIYCLVIYLILNVMVYLF